MAAPGIADDHMIIIISTPMATVDHADKIYEMDEPYPSALHQGLKRGDIKYEPLKSSSNNTMQDGLPLFEKYQFLSPGKLSMGTARSWSKLTQYV
jgi:hypothetical protein